MASLALAGYISYWSQRDALQQFEEMAETNAKFIDELQLPKSASLAEKLSTVLGVSVAFYDAAGENPQFAGAPWPDAFGDALEKAVTNSRAAFQTGGKDVAIAPFEREAMHLVLVRETRSILATGLGSTVLVPAILLTIACACLAYYLAHRIVMPLSTLTNWLPHLEHDDRAAPEIAHSVSGRGDEIGELARALEATHRRLRDEQERRRQSERMATLGRIATSLAHEIRNPASSIGLHADLLARDANNASAESIGLIRAEVDRITDLVNQWLFVVRPAPPQSGHHDLAKLVARIAESLRTAMDHAGATLRIAEPTEPLPVTCDHARIEQVMRNLLVNAMQAMSEGGEIKIRFETGDTHAVCLIHDSGPGFSEDALERFGEAFYSEREGGMGIGLTLAREVVDAHGGSIAATNAPDGGAVVRVQLPHSKETTQS
ncbi:MAG: ATP-binding protein [Opitutales bacterium]